MYTEKGDMQQDPYVDTLKEAKEQAQKFLSAHKRGVVHLTDSQHRDPIKIYFRDCFTGGFSVSNDYATFLIGFNELYPWSKEGTITDARIKACKILRENNKGMICIFKSHKGSSQISDTGIIITNGSRYEYIDHSNGIRYTLDPKTGRIRKY